MADDETPDDILPGETPEDESVEDENPDPSFAPVDRSPGETDKVEVVDLNAEMQKSYIEYAMSVIVARALPDVRDGLKPVHRRVLYAMYDGGYRPDRGFNKCARVVGDVMGNYHPHGDSAIYDAMVRLVQDWSLRYPLIQGQGNFGTPGDDPAAAPRYTECRMAPLAMEMVRDIREGTVDMVDNYDGKNKEPSVLPSRFPNLLVNGSAGIAVGMATQIPPHNLREVAAGAQFLLDNPDISKEELLEKLMEIIPGPDFPTGALVMGKKGIEEAYRTGRGSIIMRAVVEIEEIQGRTCLVITELPYQVNPDSLARKMAELVNEGRVTGIADLRDETSGRTGQRLVVVLKRDAVAKVVLNNLYKHTQLQQTFGANMLALVDGVPRTLPLSAFIRHWVEHQIDVIVRRTQFRLAEAERRIHVYRGYLKALDQLDEVIALIRRSPSADEAREGLKDLLGIDDEQALAILNLQLRRLAALERQEIQEQHDALEAQIIEYEAILASPERQRQIVSEELAEIVDKYGDDRRTQIVPYDGDMSMEDLITEEDVVVTITRGGYAKRTPVREYRAQNRGGKGRRGAALRADDVVEHFFVTSTHHWLLFFTNTGRVYRAKAYEIPEGGPTGKGQHVANLMAFQPDERIKQVLAIPDYDAAPYLVLSTRNGLVKKTRLTDYDSPRSGGLIAVNLRDGDELVGAALTSAEDDILLVSRKGQSVRFTADDTALRPMGRATSGVTGMKFRGTDDHLLAMQVVRSGTDPYVFVVFDSGMAKRTPVSEYRVQGRGGLGIKVAKATEKAGAVVGALLVDEADEVLALTERGNVVRSAVGGENGVRVTGRNTQGVIFARPAKGDLIVAVARNPEAEDAAEVEEVEAAADEAEAVAGEVEAGGDPGADDVAGQTDGVPSVEAEPTPADDAADDDPTTGGDA